MTLERVTGMTYHAAAYERQSQERKDGSAASPAVQRRNNRAEAQRRADAGEDIVWVGHFTEKLGTSAFYSNKERPEFERLLTACRNGHVNMIIVDYVSRFSRLETTDAIPIVTELLGLGVVIVSTSEGTFRKGNLMDLIHLIFRLDAAHNESRNKSRAVQGAHNLARELGGYVGKPPYGFEMYPEQVPNPARPSEMITIHKLRHARQQLLSGPFPTEGDVMRYAARMFYEGMSDKRVPKRGQSLPGSISGICSGFMASDVPTRGATVGKKTADSAWDPASLKRMLRDPLLAGFQREVVYAVRPDGTPSRTVEGYRILRDPLTMEPLPTECGPIVEPWLWRAIQPGLAAVGRGKGQSQPVEQALLSAMDLLDCECSTVMVGHRKAADPRKSSYECKRGRKVIPGTHEGSVTINMMNLDDYVARRIYALIQTAEGDPETGDILARAAQRWGVLHEAPEKRGERAELLGLRAEAAEILTTLYADREAGGYRGKMGQRAFLAAEGGAIIKMEAAEERLAELDDAATPTLPIGEWLSHELTPDDDGYDVIGPGSWWAKADINDRRELVKLFVDKIVIKKSPTDGSGRPAPGRHSPIEPRVSITWAQPEEDDSEEGEALAA